jgi:hypothetical protein
MHKICWFDNNGQIYNSYCDRMSLNKISQNSHLLMIFTHISVFDLRLSSDIFQAAYINRLCLPK